MALCKDTTCSTLQELGEFLQGHGTGLSCGDLFVLRIDYEECRRRLLLQSVRRVMATHTPLRPIDRLHWLMMRRKLGDRPPAAASPEAHNDLSKLPAATLLEVARVTAYLSRMVPGRDVAAAQAWYAQAMGQFMPPEMIPPCNPPDGDGLVVP